MGTKRNTYEETFDRLNEALNSDFYLEASWIEYSLFEDRTNSLLDKTGGLLSDPRASIDKKLKELEKRSTTDAGLLHIPEFPDILDEIRKWKNKRNPLMHQMVDLPRKWEDINTDAKNLAESGSTLIRRYSSAAMKLRTWKKKGKG